jgi:hypothetical protein
MDRLVENRPYGAFQSMGDQSQYQMDDLSGYPHLILKIWWFRKKWHPHCKLDGLFTTEHPKITWMMQGGTPMSGNTFSMNHSWLFLKMYTRIPESPWVSILSHGLAPRFSLGVAKL